MAAFLQLLQGLVVENSLTRRIEDAVRKVKSQEEWKVEYMTLEMRDREMKEEGRKEGRGIGRQEILKLNKWLLSQNRIEEAMQMAEDAELCEKLLAEYAEKK